ncbi:unnamed protein product [Arctogadus glacialis]
MFDIILKFGRHLCLDIASKRYQESGADKRKKKRDRDDAHASMAEAYSPAQCCCCHIIVWWTIQAPQKGHHACKLLRNWRELVCYTDFGDKGATWTVQTMQHNKQQDSSILVLGFADDYLRYRDISDVQTSPRAVHQARLRVTTALLQCKGNAEDFCVVCSFAEENADESMIEKVQCGLCSRWAHFECANMPMKIRLYIFARNALK